MSKSCVLTTLRFLFAFLKVGERYGDVSTVDCSKVETNLRTPSVLDFTDSPRAVMSESDGKNRDLELTPTDTAGTGTSDPDATLDTSAPAALLSAERASEARSIGPYKSLDWSLIQRIPSADHGRYRLPDLVRRTMEAESFRFHNDQQPRLQFAMATPGLEA